MTKGLFITGTDTEVGKTYITALVIKALQNREPNIGYFKAALSGDENGVNDGSYVLENCSIEDDLEECVPFIYKTPVSPHLAGVWEGNPFNLDTVARTWERLNQRHSLMVAEGSGGLVCPLLYTREKQVMLTDVIKMTRLPIAIVVPCRVGAINAAVLTASYAQSQNLEIAGFILNYYQSDDKVHQDNAVMIEALTGLPVIARVAQGDTAMELNL